MIISHSKKFIFIHVYKVAGTSISSLLRSYSYLPSKINRFKSFIGIYPSIYSNSFKSHTSAFELREMIPDLFHKYYKFAFVRNPWDWQVSLYHFAKQSPNHHQHHLLKNMEFSEYVDWRVNKDLKLQKDFICDEDDNLLVDFVGKIENLKNDLQNVANYLNIPFTTPPQLNSSDHENYISYYDSTTQKMISEAYKKDIELFNYCFGDEK